MTRQQKTRLDCYEILGLKRNASFDQIKKAYRKAALKYHPDKNSGDKKAEAKFILCTEAYKILSNSDSKKAYDDDHYQKFDFDSIFTEWLNSDTFIPASNIFTQYQKRTTKSQGVDCSC